MDLLKKIDEENQLLKRKSKYVLRKKSLYKVKAEVLKEIGFLRIKNKEIGVIEAKLLEKTRKTTFRSEFIRKRPGTQCFFEAKSGIP